MKTVVLIGNYGVGNFGDEVLREYFESLPDIQWQTVSHAPSDSQLPRLPAGIRSFLRFNWIPTVRAIAAADAVVFGGGTLFTDTESVKAGFIWWLHAFFCRFLGTPYYLAFQGIGPFRSPLARFFAQSALANAAGISVRDEKSYLRAKEILPSKKIVQSFDPFYKVFRNLNLKINEISSKNLFVIVPRNDDSGRLLSVVADALSSQTAETLQIVSLQPEDKAEKDACKRIQQQYPEAEVIAVTTAVDLLRIFRQASYVVTSRYHGAISALAMQKPFVVVSQATGDKLDALTDVSIETLDALVDVGEKDLLDFLADR